MWFASLIFLYLSFVINLKLMKKIKILSLFVQYFGKFLPEN